MELKDHTPVPYKIYLIKKLSGKNTKTTCKNVNLSVAKTLVNEVSNGIFNSVADIDKNSFLDILLEPSFEPLNNEFEKEEKRRIRKQSISQGLGR